MLILNQEHDQGNGRPSCATSNQSELCLSRYAMNHAELARRPANMRTPAGMVYTPMMYGPGMSSEAREARKNRSLLKVEGNGWDVGAAVRFLAGDEARWLTGVVLPVDAGATVAAGSELPASASINPPKTGS